jgi:hypothetical protein
MRFPPFRSQVAAIDPEPVIAVAHRGEGTGRLYVAGADVHEHDGAVRSRTRARGDPPVEQILPARVNAGGQLCQNLLDGARIQGNLVRTASGVEQEAELVAFRVGIGISGSAQKSVAVLGEPLLPRLRECGKWYANGLRRVHG